MTILTSDFFTRKCMAVLSGGQKSGRKAGFHCIVFNQASIIIINENLEKRNRTTLPIKRI